MSGNNEPQWDIVFDYSVIQKTDVAMLAVLFYDLLITYGDASRFIWKEPWHLSKILFVLARYSALINQVVILAAEFHFRPSDMACRAFVAMNSLLTVIIFIICETILLLRTSALHRQHRKVFWSLSVTFCLFSIGALIPVIVWNAQLDFVPPPVPTLPGCFGHSGTFIEFIAAYVFVAIWEITNFILALRKGYRQQKQFGFPLYMVLWYDGFQYYVYAVVGSVVEVIILFAYPEDLAGVGHSFARTIHAICSYRILLHARRLANNDDCEDDDNRQSRSQIHIRVSSPPTSPITGREVEFPLESLPGSSTMDSESTKIFEVSTRIQSASSSP